MKRIVTALIAALVLCAGSVADTYINFTLPLSFGFHNQNGDGDEMSGDTDEFLFGPSVTAEVFQTLQETFGVGLKGGLRWENNATIFGEDFEHDPECDLFGWYVAPSLGWASSSSKTKKKINLYPFIYERLIYSDAKINGKNAHLDDFVVTNMKYGASFSWQWGEEKVQNGFEIGFDFDWNSVIKYDGHRLGDDGWGFELWLGYKLSIAPFLEQ